MGSPYACLVALAAASFADVFVHTTRCEAEDHPTMTNPSTLTLDLKSEYETLD
jgi:hypothetical protein